MEETAAQQLLGSLTITPEIIQETKNIKNVDDLSKLIQTYKLQNTTSILSLILFASIVLDASDIHVEPQQDRAKLRIRIDGVLRDVTFLEQNIYNSLVSRVKILSRIKMNIAERPQDGRLTVLAEDKAIELRTSSLPSEWGESLMMRILNPRNLMTLETLGLRKDMYKILYAELSIMIDGMVAVVGPTGCGKTTTLYAFLKKIQNSGMKVITIEDPIEYHLPEISQTQVEPEKGYSFAQGLQSLMRHDPDLILVGEIRDSETAKIALQAALTGHMVLTTIHANDAASIFARLIGLGADLSSISAALKLVVSQRLIRKICKYCLILSKPSLKEREEIKRGLKNVWKKVVVKLREDVLGFAPITISLDLNKIKIPKAGAKGCEQCNFTGYKGRKGIFETFLIDDSMEKFILTNPSLASIKKLLIKKDMITIYQAGLIEVILGETTLEEIKRVVESEEELMAIATRRRTFKRGKDKERKMPFDTICRALGLDPQTDLRIVMSKLINTNFRLRTKVVLSKKEAQQLRKIKKFYKDWHLSANAADPLFGVLKRLKSRTKKARKNM